MRQARWGRFQEPECARQGDKRPRPTPGTAGKVVYCTDGDGGSPCLAVDNGSSWLRINLGAAVSATDAEEYIIAE